VEPLRRFGEVLRKWLAKALAILPEDRTKRAMLDKIRAGRDLAADVAWMLGQIESHPALEVVFCHNDGQEGNTLKVGSGPEATIRLIDFEYAALVTYYCSLRYIDLFLLVFILIFECDV
jgi:thiamine kinase-like enzyme